MRTAAREMLEEQGHEEVGLREAARRIGVSATAAYRHFASKEDLLASVAAEGFRELTVELDAAAKRPEPLIGLGVAYVEFALQKRGLFRLMFGPLLVVRAKYPALNEAARAMFSALERAVAAVEGRREEQNDDATAAWGLMHGLSSLFIDGLVPEAGTRAMAARIFAHDHEKMRPELLPAG